VAKMSCFDIKMPKIGHFCGCFYAGSKWFHPLKMHKLKPIYLVPRLLFKNGYARD
jgi:hypothetical protein